MQAVAPGHPRACGENGGGFGAGAGGGGPSPRVRGELTSHRCICPHEGGPSPRVRGEHHGIRPQNHELRAIPARAGRTQVPTAYWISHRGPSPRVRGERCSGSLQRPVPPGHPRACGENQNWFLWVGSDLRAIPARAGRTASSDGQGRVKYGPSPRVRGELRSIAPPPPAQPGHPRACGENDGGLLPRHGAQRAIPARAGRTNIAPVLGDRRAGPSPRVRGERLASQCKAAPLRAIPARAGRTPQAATKTRLMDGPSPRVRGERHPDSPRGQAQGGPSPRVRGERARTARASRHPSGHPRACGENNSRHY